MSSLSVGEGHYQILLEMTWAKLDMTIIDYFSAIYNQR